MAKTGANKISFRLNDETGFFFYHFIDFELGLRESDCQWNRSNRIEYMRFAAH